MKNRIVLVLLCLSGLPLLAKNQPKKTAVDPDEAYKNNCMRCHSSVQEYSPAQTATLVTHMRVRANLTEGETKAILQYLQDAAPAKPATRQRGKKVKSSQRKD
jgi:hypothetical protein